MEVSEDDMSIEIEVNESGNVLTIRCYAARELSPEEFAAYLSDFVEELRSGDTEIVTVPDDATH